MFRGRVVMMPKLRFLLIAGVSALGILHSMSAGAADRSKSRTQRLASGPALGKGNGSFYIGLDYNPTFNGIKDLKIIGETDEDEMDVLTGARGLFPMNALASNVTDFNSYHFDWSTPLPGLEFGNSTLALGGSIGYRIGGARVEVGIGHERFVIKGGDDTAFLLGRELALDTARGQLLSSALGITEVDPIARTSITSAPSTALANALATMALSSLLRLAWVLSHLPIFCSPIDSHH
ncbi:P44/Msp2 family outer membrane protein [Anaplasma marginale]|uniref:P44/Msp2 family outer membrane protein n=1 Tax=Anaplasma marginale TaxID=770 RepID=UPI0005C71A0A|nr:P44/Msp2 family outer membrane protein [Anaplasma marginale]